MESAYLHRGDREMGYMLRKLQGEAKEPNLGYVLAYVKQARVNGKNPHTIARYLRELRFILKRLGRKDAKT